MAMKPANKAKEILPVVEEALKTAGTAKNIKFEGSALDKIAFGKDVAKIGEQCQYTADAGKFLIRQYNAMEDFKKYMQ